MFSFLRFGIWVLVFLHLWYRICEYFVTFSIREIGFSRDKSVSGHSVTLRETVAVNSAEIVGATAYEVSGRITSPIHFIMRCLPPMKF